MCFFSRPSLIFRKNFTLVLGKTDVFLERSRIPRNIADNLSRSIYDNLEVQAEICYDFIG